MAMSSINVPRFLIHLNFRVSLQPSIFVANFGSFGFSPRKRRFSSSITLSLSPKSSEELLVVVGGGAAGIYGAIRAKTLAPNLNVLVIEKGKPLSKVKISGGGRCNVTNGHCVDNLVTFPKVKASLKVESMRKNVPELTQVGPMLVTHWGLSGPVILRLSAWGARDLSSSDYKGMLVVDFVPDIHIEDLKSTLVQHKNKFAKQKVLNSYPSEFGLVRRFWKYILVREGLLGGALWGSVSNSSLLSVASLLKQCSFRVKGKGQFKDEFVTAGGVPLSEISMKTMESRIQTHLFFAGEVLNVDGVTGGFNFQNAWSGGYIAGTSIGNLAAGAATNYKGVG